ncbi:OmpP1/FadL family transporter [Chitinibacteraceae bacterium HSL-7]
MKQIAMALRLLGASSLMFAVGHVQASGYHFGTQSASNQGVANSGGAAVFDASTIFYNPAGLSRLQGTQVSGVLNVIFPDGQFTNDGSSNATGRAIPGNDGGDFGPTTPVPHLYVSHAVNDKLVVGFGLFVPFGSHSDYDDEWVGRYNSLENQVQTVNFNPSFSYTVNDMVALGGGFSVQYLKGKLSKAIDFGTLVSAQVAPGLAGVIGSQPAYDGKIVVEGDDIGYGFNLGALFTFTPDTRAGIAYRSKIKHTLKGDADFTVPQTFGSIAALGPAAALVQGNLNRTYQDTSAKLALETPESYSVNVFHQLNDAWALMADYTRTRHSRLQELRVVMGNGSESTTTTNWKDTNRYSVGATYKLSSDWTLRGGLAYDEAPEDAGNRIPGIPDSNRTWYAVGANWAINDHSSLDLAAIYVDLASASISQTDETSKTTVKGSYDVSSITLGAQYNYRF